MSTWVQPQAAAGKLSKPRGVAITLLALIGLLFSASPALAEETHPFVTSFGSFTNPNGIAVEESTGDVYVADIATDTVYKFDASGNPVDFPALGTNALTGSATPAGSFSFPEAAGTPAAIAVDNSGSPSDPSADDLYVMDAGHEVIDKFNSRGEYVSQITTVFLSGGALMGFGLEENGDVRVDAANGNVGLFDNSATNSFLNLRPLEGGGHSVGAGEDGFAVGPNGDVYTLSECGCALKYNVSLLRLGQVDSGPGGVAFAVDPVSGHLYVDDQSAVAELDTGAMNYSHEGNAGLLESEEDAVTGALVSSFGSLQLSSGVAQQGGIAVDGASGRIYVSSSGSSPGEGKVYVFASAAPGVAAGAAANVSQTGATLQGRVDPRGGPVASCEFEYEKVHEQPVGEERAVTIPATVFSHRVACAQSVGQIGSGTSPVGVSADVGGLEPGAIYDFRLLVPNAEGSSPSEGRFATTSSFGISSFTVSFLNKDGTPDTQAGSHPYQVNGDFSMKQGALPVSPAADAPYAIRPVGNVKDVILTPPPGFVGDPNATEAKCTLAELESSKESAGKSYEFGGGHCPPGSIVGTLEIHTDTGGVNYREKIYNMVPPHGVAAQFGANYIIPKAFVNIGLQTGGQYPVAGEGPNISALEHLVAISTTLYGEAGQEAVNEAEEAVREHKEGATANLEEAIRKLKPFLTMPTGCTGPLRSSLSADSYQEPGHYLSMSSVTSNASGEPVPLTGCSKLTFPVGITVAPDVSDASSPSGLTVAVQVPQTSAFYPGGLAGSTVRNTTVALPAGVSINPSGSDGLEACSEGLAGFTGFQEFNPEFEPGVKTVTFTPTPIDSLEPGVSFCPDGSKVGTVKIISPDLTHPLEGALYVAAQNENPFGSLIAMYLVVEDPISGSTVKLAGEVRLCESVGQVLSGMSCQAPGQIVSTFENTPDLPFEELELHFFGGERAPLTTPSRCGTYTTQASFTPWDGNAPVNTTSSFQITSGPNGSPCPGQSLPFKPTLNAGTTSNQAGGFSPFTMTMSRADGQQNLQAVTLKMPSGLSGLLAGVELCPEPQADEGTCGPNSLIGETIVSVGVGGEPFTVKGGRVYITGPYRGAPFGLTIDTPAKAGPYDLEAGTPCDCVVVRAKIEVDPSTAELTITSDDSGPYKIPTILKGIPLEIQHVNVTVNRPGFTFNPTSCNPKATTGSLDSTEGATDALSVPFQATNCEVLKFEPKLAASTSGKTSRANGASLAVKLTYPSGSLGKDTNIRKVKVDLPKQLPSRLTTLQKACTVAAFEANPASCPVDSRVGHAKAITPLVPVPLEGPAYFVSHGGAKFPELVVVLEGYGVTVDLHGETFISKAGITSSTFSTVPDAPVGSFELTLPEGPYSALAANGNLCTSKLAMPTAFVAQNGAEIHKSTKIGVSGCPKIKKAKKKAKKAGGKAKGKK